MLRYTVFYIKDLPNPMKVSDVFDERAYALMGEVRALSLENLYSRLQDPSDVAFTEKCDHFNVHTSMSPGDVARDEMGVLWACDFRGWKQVF